MQRLCCHHGVQGSLGGLVENRPSPFSHIAYNCKPYPPRNSLTWRLLENPTMNEFSVFPIWKIREIFPAIVMEGWISGLKIFTGTSRWHQQFQQGLESPCSTLYLLIVPLPHGQVVVFWRHKKTGRGVGGVLKRRLGEIRWVMAFLDSRRFHSKMWRAQ